MQTYFSDSEMKLNCVSIQLKIKKAHAYSQYNSYNHHRMCIVLNNLRNSPLHLVQRELQTSRRWRTICWAPWKQVEPSVSLAAMVSQALKHSLWINLGHQLNNEHVNINISLSDMTFVSVIFESVVTSCGAQWTATPFTRIWTGQYILTSFYITFSLRVNILYLELLLGQFILFVCHNVYISFIYSPQIWLEN